VLQKSSLFVVQFALCMFVVTRFILQNKSTVRISFRTVAPSQRHDNISSEDIKKCYHQNNKRPFDQYWHHKKWPSSTFQRKFFLPSRFVCWIISGACRWHV